MMTRTRILLIGLSIIIAIILIIVLIINRPQEPAWVKNYEPAAVNVQERRMENQRIGEEVYKSLLMSIQDSIQGIVCWGDEEMVGSRSGTLPARLSDIIDSTLFAEIENDLAEKAKLYNAHDLHINVVNMGASNEGFHEILTRTGAHQLVLGEDYTIPAGTDTKNITLADPDGNIMIFAEQQFAKFRETTIGGITGRLYDGTEYYDSTHLKLAFGRDVSGTSVTVSAGTPVYTAGAEQYRTYIPVLFFAESDEINISEFTEGINDILSIYGDGSYVLICTQQKKTPFGIRH